MKKIKNLFLVFALTATFAFGDEGHTNGGNRCVTCDPPPACTENCGGFAGGDQGVLSGTEPEAQGDETSLISYWSELFFELIGQ